MAKTQRIEKILWGLAGIGLIPTYFFPLEGQSCLAFIATATAITLAAGAALGAAGNIIGSKIQGDAARSAGDAQAKATQDAVDKQIAERGKEIKAAVDSAQMSPDEIKSINQILATKGAALSASQQSIAKQQAELDAVDPNVRAAGENLYGLLKGESAKILAPIEKKIQQQRNERVNQLASQLGPGFMTSSAGIEALNKFDTDAALTIGSAQQNALAQMTQTYSSLFGSQQAGQNAITAATGNAFANALAADQTVLAADQNVTQRITSAQIGAASANPINFMAPAAVAGNSFAGDQLFGKGISDAGTGLAKLGGQLAGSNLFSNSATANAAGASAPGIYDSVDFGVNFGDSLAKTNNNSFSLGAFGG